MAVAHPLSSNVYFLSYVRPSGNAGLKYSGISAGYFIKHLNPYFKVGATMSTANGSGPPFLKRNVPVCLPLKYWDGEDFRYAMGFYERNHWSSIWPFSWHFPFFQDRKTQMTQTVTRNITEIIKFALVRPAMHSGKRRIHRLIVISHRLTRKVCQCLPLRWWTHDHWHSPP